MVLTWSSISIRCNLIFPNINIYCDIDNDIYYKSDYATDYIDYNIDYADHNVDYNVYCNVWLLCRERGGFVSSFKHRHNVVSDNVGSIDVNIIDASTIISIGSSIYTTITIEETYAYTSTNSSSFLRERKTPMDRQLVNYDTCSFVKLPWVQKHTKNEKQA